MRDSDGRNAPHPDRPLAVLAKLYAEGEMDATEAAAFEERLAGDQAARDALCQAVQHSRSLAGLAPSTPHPGYRERVRARLGNRPGWS